MLVPPACVVVAGAGAFAGQVALRVVGPAFACVSANDMSANNQTVPAAVRDVGVGETIGAFAQLQLLLLPCRRLHGYSYEDEVPDLASDLNEHQRDVHSWVMTLARGGGEHHGKWVVVVRSGWFLGDAGRLGVVE